MKHGAFLFLILFSPFLFGLTVFRPVLREPLSEVTYILPDEQPFQVILEGVSWVYQGAGEGIEFLSDAILNTEVRFNLKPTKYLNARYPLKFFRQDLPTGDVSLQTIWIEPSSLKGKAKASSETITTQAAIREGRETLINWSDRRTWEDLHDAVLQDGAARLGEWGDFQGALELTRELERRGRRVSRELGDLYYQAGDNERAYEAYTKAMKESPTEETLVKQVFLAMLLQDSRVIPDVLRYWITTFPAPEEKAYLMVLNYLIQSQQWEQAVRWGNLYESFYPCKVAEDQYTFLMGNLFEGDSPHRNLRLSLQFYDRLLKEFPLSYYWNRGYDRFLWLKGFYFLR